MNSKHRRTLLAVFAEPVPGGLASSEIESLLIAVGYEVIEGSGSRVRFARGGKSVVFHRPHPAKEARRYQVRDARKMLTECGIIP